MATKFKDGLISGDEIKSEGDIQAISGKNIVAVSSTTAKKITMHHDVAGGHIDATQQLEIDSPYTIVKASSKNILSGDTTETKLYHSKDGTDRIVTSAGGITVYGSDGVTAKRFKFPVLEDDASPAVGSTANTDYALIQAQKIGTAVGETSVFDFSLGDNRSNDKTLRDEFRFRFKSNGINDNHEYSLMDIGALNNGVAILDLTVSHDQRDDDVVGESANSQIKAGKFIGEASLLAATVLPSTATVNTHSTVTAAGQNLVVLDNVTAAIVGMRITGTGIAAGTTITGIDTGTKTITLSDNTSAVIPADENLTIETDFGKGLVNNTTDDLSEGTSNQYFTQPRARGSISVTEIDPSVSDAQYWPASGGTGGSGDFCNELLKVALNLATTPADFKAWAETTALDGFAYGDLDKNGEIKAHDGLLALKLATDGAYADVDAAVINRWVDIIEPNLKIQSWFVESLTAQLPIGLLSYDNSTGVLKYKPSDLSSFLTSSTVPAAATDTIGGMKLVDNTDQAIAANTVSAETGRTYAVQLNSDDQAVVNVPWSDTDTNYGKWIASADAVDKDINSGKKLIFKAAGDGSTTVEMTDETDGDGNATGNRICTITGNNTVTTAATRSTLVIDTTDSVTFGGVEAGVILATTELRSKGDVVAYYSSDRRLKENIVNIPNALDKVNQLNGVTYDWTEAHIKSRGGEDDYFVKKNDTGLIAQEVEQVLPEVVRSREDGYLGIQYDKIVGLLVEAIKELKVEVEELKKNK